jgi:hypothetical protein
MLNPFLFIGRSAEMVENYVGLGGTVDMALSQYRSDLQNRTTVQLSV